MRSITLNDKSILHLPQTWDELSPSLRPLAFDLLSLLLSGAITPQYYRIRMLLAITGFSYKKSWLKITRDAIKMLITPHNKHRDILRSRTTAKRNIHHNLIALASTLDFAFTLDNYRIIPRNDFFDNPFINTKLSTLNTPYFRRDIVVTTNITARQFCDCVDILSAMDDKHNQELARHIVAILYHTRVDKLPRTALQPYFLFGVTFWFASILSFFRSHHIYGILFQNSSSNSQEHISTGMNESILHLIQAGYTDTPDMPLIDFFDAQIKSLKDTISRAIAQGAKPIDIASRTHIPLNTVISLSA